MGIKTELLSSIDRYLDETGMSKTAFGIAVARDGGFIERIKSEKHGLTDRTIDRARDFMTANPPEAAPPP